MLLNRLHAERGHTDFHAAAMPGVHSSGLC